MRMLITGSRGWTDYETLTDAMVHAVLEWIEDHPDIGKGPTDWVTVVHGACPAGADQMADDFCTKVSLWNVERHPANWREMGKGAGLIRNREMVDSGIELCLSFIKNESPGATHCTNYAEAKGVRTIRYTA